MLYDDINRSNLSINGSQTQKQALMYLVLNTYIYMEGFDIKKCF